MTGTLDELLSEAIRPEADAIGDWDGVVGIVRRRHRRRAVAFRATALSFLLLAGLAVIVSVTGTGVDTIPAPSDFARPQDSAATRWPSAQAIFDSTAPRPSAHLWLGWLVGLGLPVLAGIAAWLCAPRHLRADHTGQRWARFYLGAITAFAAGLVFVVALGVLSFFAYDVRAVVINRSLLFTLFSGAMNGLPWLGGAAAISLSMTGSGFHSAAPALSRRGALDRWRRMWELLLTLLGAFVVGTLLEGFEGLLRWSAWVESIGSEPAGRGMWRAMVPGDRTFLNASGSEIPAVWALVGLLLATLAARIMWRFCRRTIAMALAGDRFATDVLGRLRDIPSRQYLGGAMILTGLLLPLSIYGSTLTDMDRLATSTAPPPSMGDVSSGENRYRSPIGTDRLVEIEFWSRGGRSASDDLFEGSPLPAGQVLPGDWRTESCNGTNGDDTWLCLSQDVVDTDRWQAFQSGGSAQLRLVGDPPATSDARAVFPFGLVAGVFLSLWGTTIHGGRVPGSIVGRAITVVSLLMVRSSLEGFSRTAKVVARQEEVLGRAIDSLTADELLANRVYEDVHNVWPIWHYPFAATSLALWLAAAVLGVRLVQPDRRLTALTSVLAAALTAWVALKYGGIAADANHIVD